jgi:hypothetical protein
VVTRDEKRQKLESFGRGPALLSAALRGFPKKMWLYRASTGRWSIHEIIHHLADSEASGYVQCRSVIAEPGGKALQLNAGRWADSLGYYHQSTGQALELIRRLRKLTYQLLASLPEPAWAYAVENSDGTQTNLYCWLDRQERHIPHHIEQMQENYDCWFKLHPPRKAVSLTSLNPADPQEQTQSLALSLGVVSGC